MNKHDAAKILNLTGEITAKSVKAAYRKACSLYHPDRNPAGTEIMKAVNEAYGTLKGFNGRIETNEEDYSEKLNISLNSIINIEGLNIEVCGSWIWVTGNTKPTKETLKEAGFRWARNKSAWYLKPEDDKKRRYGKAMSLEEIRARHGSKAVKQPQRKAIA